MAGLKLLKRVLLRRVEKVMGVTFPALKTIALGANELGFVRSWSRRQNRERIHFDILAFLGPRPLQSHDGGRPDIRARANLWAFRDVGTHKTLARG